MRLGLLAIAVFTANLGLSVIFPLVPHLAAADPRAVGWIFSCYALTLVPAQILGGVLADRHEPGRILALALWLYLATLLGFVVSRSVPSLMINRAIEGFAVGLVVPQVMKLTVNGAPPDRLGRSIGFVMGTGGLGFIVGPVLGSVLAPYGLALPFLAAAVVAGISAVCVSLNLPDAIPSRDDTSLGALLRDEGARLVEKLRTPSFLALVLPLMALKMNFATLQADLPVFGAQVLGAGLKAVGALFVVTAVSYGVMQPLAGRAADRLPTTTLLTGTFFVLAALLLTLGIPHSYWLFLPLYALFSLAQSAGILFALKHLGAGIGEGVNGRAFGLASAIADTGMILAPSAVMPLYAWRHEAPFWALAAIALVALLAFRRLGAAPRLEALNEAL
ncbi:MAG TPA: MFS transporter [Oscillatoriaceae cyanobacterium]